jgi:hypothetical protein
MGAGIPAAGESIKASAAGAFSAKVVGEEQLRLHGVELLAAAAEELSQNEVELLAEEVVFLLETDDLIKELLSLPVVLQTHLTGPEVGPLVASSKLTPRAASGPASSSSSAKAFRSCSKITPPFRLPPTSSPSSAGTSQRKGGKAAGPLAKM